MTKVIVGVTILLLIGTGIYVFPKEKDAPPANQQSGSSPSPANPMSNPSEATASYIDYSKDIIAKTPGQKIIFFHAPWCPQCRALEADIQKGPVPSGVTIIKTDYDSMQELRQKYGVTLQTTLVKVDDQGELIKKYVAYDEPTLDSLIKNLL